jgi:hypothetical protein
MRVFFFPRFFAFSCSRCSASDKSVLSLCTPQDVAQGNADAIVSILDLLRSRFDMEYQYEQLLLNEIRSTRIRTLCSCADCTKGQAAEQHERARAERRKKLRSRVKGERKDQLKTLRLERRRQKLLASANASEAHSEAHSGEVSEELSEHERPRRHSTDDLLVNVESAETAETKQRRRRRRHKSDDLSSIVASEAEARVKANFEEIGKHEIHETHNVPVVRKISRDLMRTASSTMACAARLQMRRRIISEIATTESSYLNSLRVLNGVRRRTKNLGIAKEELHRIFGNVNKLVRGHAKLGQSLVDDLESFADGSASLAEFFRSHVSLFRSYSDYVCGYRSATIESYILSRRVSEYAQIVSEVAKTTSLDFASYLIQPVQRLPRIILLLTEAVKYSEPNSKSLSELKSAVDEIQAILTQINSNIDQVIGERMRVLFEVEKSIKGEFQTFVTRDRSVVKHSNIKLRLLSDAKRNRLALKLHKNSVRNVLLCNDVIVVNKISKAKEQFAKPFEFVELVPLAAVSVGEGRERAIIHMERSGETWAIEDDADWIQTIAQQLRK